MDIIKISSEFSTQGACVAHLERIRWPQGPVCPYCESNAITGIKSEHRHHCRTCNKSFGVTVGTIFHNTKLPLQKWFYAIALVIHSKKGIAARQLARYIDINKNTAWRILMKIRAAMREHGYILRGIIEADETYVGGKNRNRHSDKKVSGCQGRSNKDKVPVVGVLQRQGRIIAKSRHKTDSRTLFSFIRQHVEPGSTVITDEWRGYNKVKKSFEHKYVNHKKGEYVRKNIYTNTIEGFWTLFKRGFIGQYHQISRDHLDKYLDEFCFRYNNRDRTDVFEALLSKGLGTIS